MDTFKHGTSSSYNYRKCRCDECRAWKKAEARAYYERHREQVIAKNSARAKANRPKYNEAQKRRRAADPEAARARDKERYERDKEGYYRRQRKWNQKNAWRVWFHRWSRNERLRGQEYDPETLEWIKTMEEPLCMYCGGAAQTIDHMLPRAKGGTNHRENLTPVCHMCNQRKGAMTVEAFLARMRRENDA